MSAAPSIVKAWRSAVVETWRQDIERGALRLDDGELLPFSGIVVGGLTTTLAAGRRVETRVVEGRVVGVREPD
jgi:hypothetical protein